jgi:DNA-binding transcriptional MocR family regulator
MSPEEVAQAVAIHNDGRSIRYIANLLGIPRSTVSDAIQRFRETGSYARRPGQGGRYAQCCFASRVPFGGGGVMIWGGISLAACTALVTLRRGSTNADRYICECLEEHVVPFAPFVGADFLLMHDKARSPDQ